MYYDHTAEDRPAINYQVAKGAAVLLGFVCLAGLIAFDVYAHHFAR